MSESILEIIAGLALCVFFAACAFGLHRARVRLRREEGRGLDSWLD